MELDERPTEQYSDIGGLDKQIEEVGSISLQMSGVSCGLCGVTIPFVFVSWWRLLYCL